MNEEVAKNNIWFGKKGNGVPRIKKFLNDDLAGLVPETLWLAKEVGTNDSAKKEVVKLALNEQVFDTPKPELLVSRILHIATNPGDLVLDSFLGSGTTAAVAHKMGRHYIGIEMGDHAMTHCVPRLQKVIEGEQGGISEAVGWQGGGGFRFYRLGVPLLEDGRIFVLEYKGEYLITADKAKEKINIGQLWADKSDSKGVFLMAQERDEEGRSLRDQIAAAIA